MPDISYPSNYDPEAIGESALAGPLPWDQIQATRYRTANDITPLLPDLHDMHEERVSVIPNSATCAKRSSTVGNEPMKNTSR
ncbi:MAG: carboxy terminal-processing peptidase [Gammaproteobacteria bacterium]|nr:carboxy terminal-processing peptidase [Gammaproteobacteria bacterium]